jgi:hypothetical protein
MNAILYAAFVVTFVSMAAEAWLVYQALRRATGDGA